MNIPNLVQRLDRGRCAHSRMETMMQKLKFVPLLVLLAGGLAAPLPALAAGGASQAAQFRAACIHVSPDKPAMCACLASFVMSVDPQLRADIILSMANPAKYRAKAEAGKISHAEMNRWIQYNGASGRKCHVDD